MPLIPLHPTPARVAAGVLLVAATAAVALGGAATASAAPSRTVAGRPAETSGPSLVARPLRATDLTASTAQLIAFENSVDSTPTAAENEGYADEWNLAAGCMAARGFYVNPTVRGKSTPEALAALNAPYDAANPATSGCFPLAQHLVGARDPH